MGSVTALPAAPGTRSDGPPATIVDLIERAGERFGDREAFRSLGRSLS